MASVLIIESNNSQNEYLTSLMRKHEYKVLSIPRAEDPLQTIRRKHPDAVLLGTPKNINTSEALDTIRNESEIYNTPVIVLAEKKNQKDKLSALKNGADAYMAKPIDEEELLIRLANLIKRTKQIQTKAFMDTHQATVESTGDVFMRELLDFFAENIENPKLTIDDLADELAMSKSTIQRKTKNYAGKTFNQLLREFRLEQAKQMLNQDGGNVGDIAFAVGFNSISYFSYTFKRYYGYSPKKISMRKREAYKP